MSLSEAKSDISTGPPKTEDLLFNKEEVKRIVSNRSPFSPD